MNAAIQGKEQEQIGVWLHSTIALHTLIDSCCSKALKQRQKLLFLPPDHGTRQLAN